MEPNSGESAQVTVVARLQSTNEVIDSFVGSSSLTFGDIRAQLPPEYHRFWISCRNSRVSPSTLIESYIPDGHIITVFLFPPSAFSPSPPIYSEQQHDPEFQEENICDQPREQLLPPPEAEDSCLPSPDPSADTGGSPVSTELMTDVEPVKQHKNVNASVTDFHLAVCRNIIGDVPLTGYVVPIPTGTEATDQDSGVTRETAPPNAIEIFPGGNRELRYIITFSFVVAFVARHFYHDIHFLAVLLPTLHILVLLLISINGRRLWQWLLPPSLRPPRTGEWARLDELEGANEAWIVRLIKRVRGVKEITVHNRFQVFLWAIFFLFYSAFHTHVESLPVIRYEDKKSNQENQPVGGDEEETQQPLEEIQGEEEVSMAGDPTPADVLGSPDDTIETDLS